MLSESGGGERSGTADEGGVHRSSGQPRCSREEFGSFGIDKLGGEKALLEQLQSQDMDLFKQYDSLRQQCCNGEVDKHESDND